MRQVISIRKANPSFARGDLRIIDSANQKVLSFLRRLGDEVTLVVVNLSQFSQDATLELQEYAGYTPLDLFSKNRFHEIGLTPYKIMIAQHEYYWLQLKQPKEGVVEAGEMVEIELKKRWHVLFDKKHSEKFANRALRSYLCKAQWFDVKAQEIKRLELDDAIFLESRENAPAMAIYRVEYFDKTDERYMVALDFAYTKDLPQDVLESPSAIICTLSIDGKEGYVYDASYSNLFRLSLIEIFARRRQLKGRHGGVEIALNSRFKRSYRRQKPPEISNILLEKKKNMHIDYEKRFFLKLHRRLEEGIPPDREIMQYLRDKERFVNIPRFFGAVDYRSGEDGTCYQLALMEEWISDSYKASIFFHDNAMRFFDEVLADSSRSSQTKTQNVYSLEQDINTITERVLQYSERFVFEMSELMGRRIAQMHTVLAQNDHDEAFSPQPFSTLYLRSYYQSFRTVFRKMCLNLAKIKALFPDEKDSEAVYLLEKEEAILKHFKIVYKESIIGLKIRIHDDLELENILFNGKDFFIIDFGGDKTKPNTERRLKHPIFSDLAEVMFSMDLATFWAIRDNPKVSEEESGFIWHWRDIYQECLYSVFLSGYFNEAGKTKGLYSKERAHIRLLLDMELMKKASIEINEALNDRDRFIHALRFAIGIFESLGVAGEIRC